MAKKHKKNKRKNNLQPTSPIKVVLPVIIGLAVIVVVALILGLTSRKAGSAKVDNPNKAYATVGGYKFTNQEVYENLKSSTGLNLLAELTDRVLLKDVEVTDEDHQAAYDKAVYGDDLLEERTTLAELKEELEGLTGLAKSKKEAEIAELEKEIADEEKDAEETFKFNMYYMGFKDEASIKDYVTLLAKREVYAKGAYKDYINDGHDFSDDEYLAAYKALGLEKYENEAQVIVISFNTLAQAKAYLKLLSIPVYTTDLSKGWMKTNDQDKIDELKAERAALETDMAAASQSKQDLERDLETLQEELAALQEASEQDQEAITSKQAEITSKTEEIEAAESVVTNATNRIAEIDTEVESLTEMTSLTDLEVAKLFIELYNLYYAYYLGGDTSTYFNVDEDGNYITLKDEYKVLKEGVHYNVSDSAVEFNLSALQELEKEYGYIKFVYTETEAKATLSNVLIDTLVEKTASQDITEEDDAEETHNYTFEPTLGNSNYYYVAYKFGSSTKVEKSHLESLISQLEEEELNKEAIQTEIDEIKASLKGQLIEDGYTSDEQTRLLMELRQEKGLKIYDRYLNATYKAAYDYLYGTTLNITDYPEYSSDGKAHKKNVFSVAGTTYTAQEFFEELQRVNGTSGLISMLNSYAILSSDYNKIYNPYTKKTYDKSKFNEYLSSDLYTNLYSGQIKTVKGFKFAFEQDLFSSYGFDHSYGWENFLKDYLLAKDEKFLAAQLFQSDLDSEYYLDSYKVEDINAEMQKIYDKYYSMKVVNMVVFVDFNRDGSGDTFNTEENGVQQYWNESQLALAQELTNLFYEVCEGVDESSLDAKLKAVATEYNQATYQTAQYGKFIAAGLHVTCESAAEYTSSSSLVQEFHDEMAKIYKMIEEADGYKLGEWTDEEQSNGYKYEPVFASSFGFHRVTIINANDRVYVDSDKSSDLTKLTKKVYKTYQDDADSMDETLKTAVETYFVPALSSVGTTNAKNLLKQQLRLALIDNLTFDNDSYNENYKALEEVYTNYIQFLIDNE